MNHPVGADDLLGLVEGPVGQLGLASSACFRERDARPAIPINTGWRPSSATQHTSLLQGFVVLHHRRHGLGVGHGLDWLSFL